MHVDGDPENPPDAQSWTGRHFRVAPPLWLFFTTVTLIRSEAKQTRRRVMGQFEFLTPIVASKKIQTDSLPGVARVRRATACCGNHSWRCSVGCLSIHF